MSICYAVGEQLLELSEHHTTILTSLKKNIIVEIMNGKCLKHAVL